MLERKDDSLERTSMKRIHIIGNKNNGKTTLVLDILHECNRRGLKVGTVKHTHHTHELDTPGKDSYRHREASGRQAAIISKDLTAVYLQTERLGDPYETLAPFYADCDFVVVEGNRGTSAPKVEVWREETGRDPLAFQYEGVLAMITDDACPVELPVWPRKDITVIVDEILSLLEKVYSS